MNDPDMTGWEVLEPATISQLRRVWEYNREMFTIYRDQALANAAARKRSLARADRRNLEQFEDRAKRIGINPADVARFTDLSDLHPEVRERLIDLRRRDGLVAFAVALGEARATAAARTQP